MTCNMYMPRCLWAGFLGPFTEYVARVGFSNLIDVVFERSVTTGRFSLAHTRVSSDANLIIGGGLSNEISSAPTYKRAGAMYELEPHRKRKRSCPNLTRCRAPTLQTQFA